MAEPVGYRGETERRRRPKDRKQQILAVAARRFRDIGFHNVGMAEIAETVGITAGALYRHFRGKHDLLLAVMSDAFDDFDRALDGSTDLDELITRLAAVTLERRELGVLWEREARHLPPDAYEAMRSRLVDGSGRITKSIASTRPGMSPEDAELLGWAVQAVTASPAYHTVELDRAAFETVLGEAVRAVTTASVDPTMGVVAPDPRTGAGRLFPASRREALLASAIDLFSERGYHSVGIADVGAAAGITGPSVYSYFSSKSDILATALNRGNECLLLGLHGALRHATTAAHALERLVGGYVGFVLGNTELVALLVTETANLPEDQQHHFRQVQHEYVTEWVALVEAARRGIDPSKARILVHAALGMINDLARIRHLRARPALADELSRLGLAILTVA